MTNRGRFQAQGNDTEKSSPWATNEIVYKLTGSNLLDSLQNQLTPSELAARNIAIQKARNFVNTCPTEGVFSLLKKSYKNNNESRKVRIDIEVIAGNAFVNNNSQ